MRDPTPSKPSPAERRHRVLLVVLVLLALLHPVWSRLVNHWWDGATPARPAPASAPEKEEEPPAASDRTATASDRAPSSIESNASEAVVVEADPVETVSAPAVEPIPPQPPTVLGASIGAAAEVQVLVDLHGETDLDPLLGEICLQAQLFVERALSRQQIRLHSQPDAAPSEDLGLHRCP